MRGVGGRFRLGARVPGRAWPILLWWDLCCFLSECWLRLLYRIRVIGAERVPASGPVLFVSNHQSYYDPMINGCIVSRRQFTPIASAHLFKFPPFALLIRSFGAIPVAAGAGDKGTMKIALSELEAGRCVLIYPEGTRCDDGYVAEFQRGLSLLLKRSGATVLPIAIEGACDVWPRGTTLPRLRGRLAVIAGTPRSSESILEEGPREALESLRVEIDDLRLEARAMLREQTGGRWPLEANGEGPSPR